MELQQIKIKIYLKTKRRPLCFILDKDEQVEKIIEDMSMREFVRLGNIVFKSSDFKYMDIK